MDFAFVLDPLPLLKAYKDTSVAMMRALDARGHRIWALEQPDIYWRDGATRAKARLLTLSADDHRWYDEAEAEDRALTDYAAVMMRKDPPFDMEYVYSTYLLEAAEREGARVFNRPRAIRDFNEKLAITEFRRFVTPTLVTRDGERIGAFIDEHRDAIVKPLDGMGGVSVYRVRDDDPNRNVIVETVSQFGARTVMAQRYIPEIVDGDKRILLIAGEVVPFCLARIPKPGETRGNLAAGGRGVARPLSSRDREIAEALAGPLWRAGLLVVGIDVIGDYLTEVNVTSPTCFVEIAEQSGFDVAGLFATSLLRACGSA
ncbi:MAG TPA: glutathione synthase [Casimicrobiaceae bacterium]|jgi:glutathione synthase|nr:glutathione synthase [Casimicrobiaceae bacterium]